MSVVRRFYQFRLWHLIVVMVALSVAFAYAANLVKQWRRPTALNEAHLSFYHNYIPPGPKQHEYQVITIGLSLPETTIHFDDYPPFGDADECSIIRPGSPSTMVRYDGPNPIWAMHPQMPKSHQDRYRKLYAFYLTRISVERQAYLRDPVGSGLDPTQLPPEERLYITLKPNRLEPRDPDIDYDYWLTPPDRW